jgi:hypothetical protein
VIWAPAYARLPQLDVEGWARSFQAGEHQPMFASAAPPDQKTIELLAQLREELDLLKEQRVQLGTLLKVAHERFTNREDPDRERNGAIAALIAVLQYLEHLDTNTNPTSE